MANSSDVISNGSILYGVVAKGSCILASHSAKIGNFNDVARDLLTRIERQPQDPFAENPSRMTYTTGDHQYHYLRCNEQGVLFLCITDSSFPRKYAFNFMDILAKQLKEQFPYQLQSNSTAIPFSINSEFEPVISAEMKRINRDASSYNKNRENESSDGDQSEDEERRSLINPTSGPSSQANTSQNNRNQKKKGRPGDPDKVERVKDEVARVKDIMVTNIEALLERGERLDLLVDKTEQLSSNAVTFKQASRTLARRMWWQNFKIWILIAIGVLVVIYIIISASCGGPAWPNCVGSGGHGNGTNTP